jgi:hypothetical protein
MRNRFFSSDRTLTKTFALRVLHGPLNVGNQPWGLSRAERELGIQSELVMRSTPVFGYSADRVLGRAGMPSLREKARLATFGLVSPFNYDVLHYYFGQSFLYRNGSSLGFAGRLIPGDGFEDLRIAKRLGRKVFMTLQGCDARLAGKNNQRNEWTACAPGMCASYETCRESVDIHREWLISEILPLCDRVFYLNPDLGYAVPHGTFLPYTSVDVERVHMMASTPARRLRIVHAPSVRSVKGTSLILSAVEKLKADYDFEFVLVENMSHPEAIRLYQSADLAIDQVLLGWYGGFAVEIMAMGKPVACYMRDEDLRFLPAAMVRDLPILRVHPGRLAEDLAAILSMSADARAEISARSRSFVERWHNPRKIAKAMVEIYRDPASPFLLD